MDSFVLIAMTVMSVCGQPGSTLSAQHPIPHYVKGHELERFEPDHIEQEDRVEQPSTYQPAAITGAFHDSTHGVDAFVAVNLPTAEASRPAIRIQPEPRAWPRFVERRGGRLAWVQTSLRENSARRSAVRLPRRL